MYLRGRVKNQHLHTPPTCGSTPGPLSTVSTVTYKKCASQQIGPTVSFIHSTNQPTNQLWLILVSWTTSRPYSWKFSQQRRKLLPISTAFSTLKLVHLNLGISRETTVNHETMKPTTKLWVNLLPQAKIPSLIFFNWPSYNISPT